jgi:signal transduction histidine kinase
MVEATLARAFEPFFAGGSDSPHERTGLGLSVAKGLVEAMGGTIHLASQPTAGTTVEIRLPAVGAAAASPAADRPIHEASREGVG